MKQYALCASGQLCLLNSGRPIVITGISRLHVEQDRSLSFQEVYLHV
jgi:hypothetical protein